MKVIISVKNKESEAFGKLLMFSLREGGRQMDGPALDTFILIFYQIDKHL